MKLTNKNKIILAIIGIVVSYVIVNRYVLNKGGGLPFGSKLALITSSRIENIIYDLPRSSNSSFSSRSIEGVEYIIWHHSATSTGTPEAFAEYHVKKNRWPGIGYHFVIQQDGKIYQTNELNTMSWHVTGKNRDGIGVCLVGNFDNVRPSEAQIKSAKWLAKYLRGFLNKNLISKGHTDYANKSCPGNQISSEVKNW